jgi:DNA invertase Pin-like site-specific DNA recombinase
MNPTVPTVATQKVTAGHLARLAYLYIRQSSLRQVLEHTESTVRQYALRDRAVALGWPREQIVVVDEDQGHSGATTAGRVGFQTLVAEVSLGRVGLVMGLEVSRLARNNSDWHRLLEICALTQTLILDEDGIYDPATFNDRLLLGLKGAMSEAELHVLKARLRGGILNKAQRGALKLPLPIGLAYRDDGEVILDPDEQIQAALRLLFATFRRTGSATAVTRHFREQQLRFPRRVRTGPHRGAVVWMALHYDTVLDVLHNPRYAGAFAFGRSRTQPTVDGGHRVIRLPREQWVALVPGAHVGYLSWEEFEEHQHRLRANATAQQPGPDRQPSPPREGPALLQGMAICAGCGDRMGVHYHERRGRLVPDYVCQRRAIRHGAAACQRVPGGPVDAAIGDLLVRAVTPLALEAALAVEVELAARADQADRLRRQQVERAQYEADLAQRRFLRVDPDNRLVADVLEAEWNAKLRVLAEAQDELARAQGAAIISMSEAERAAIRALAADFPRLWRDPRTPDRERKRMARLLIEDVTLHKGDHLVAQVRFRGGTTETLTLPRPRPVILDRQTDPAIVAALDGLLETHTDGEAAAALNAAGHHSREGRAFHRQLVVDLRRSHRLPSHKDRLRARGWLTEPELAAALGVATQTVAAWWRRGYLQAERANEKGERFYEPPGAHIPAKWKHKPPRPELHPETSNGGAVCG